MVILLSAVVWENHSRFSEAQGPKELVGFTTVKILTSYWLMFIAFFSDITRNG